jgi:hypothetical protein
MLPKKTNLGTPISPCWDDAWINTVTKAERERGRRICGARTHAGTPCLLQPNHENGRCKFHGGFELTGAQPGNRNAVIHGLYSRALRVCGPLCPLWDQCPCAGDDVAKLPGPERPTCPYEATEYQTALTDITVYADIHPESDPMRRRTAHQAALLHVMMSRAALALRDAPLTLDTGAKAENYQNLSPKPNPLLDAYFRIAREYHNCLQWLKDNRREDFRDTPLIEHQRRASIDASLSPEDQAQLDTTENIAELRARQYMEQAVQKSRSPYWQHMEEAVETRDRAKWLAPNAAEIWDVQLPHEIEQQEEENESKAPG